MRSNRLLLFSFLLVFPLLTRAQSNNPRGGHFGFKAGPTLTQLAVSGISPYVPKRTLDPHLGVMYRYRIQRFVLQPELLFSSKGGSFQIERLGRRETIRNRYIYASVPVLFGYIPTEGITLQAGPEFSYALNAGQTNGPGNRTDLGIAVGAHYDFLDFLDKFSLHVRYVYGLNNVSPEPLATYKNRTLQVGIVYNLYPKEKKK